MKLPHNVLLPKIFDCGFSRTTHVMRVAMAVDCRLSHGCYEQGYGQDRHMRKFVLETEILGSCKKQIRQFVLIKIKELMRHSISRETNRIINLAKSAD